jgi:hypothetical protein
MRTATRPTQLSAYTLPWVDVAGISEPEDRTVAAKLRAWFTQEFLDALMA